MKKIKLSEMKIDELKKFHKDINSGIYDVLSAKQSVNHKKSFGSTSPSMVKKAATKWVNKLHNEINKRSKIPILLNLDVDHGNLLSKNKWRRFNTNKYRLCF